MTTLAPFTVDQRRADTPVERHLWSANLSQCRAAACRLSAESPAIVYIKAHNGASVRVIARYRGGLEVSA